MSSDTTFEMFGPRLGLRSSIIETLRAAIIAGQLDAGVVYSAPKLAAQFGVSPTPVREAMIALDREGLVEAVPNKGFRVRELTATELDELSELRLLIEVPVVARIAQMQLPKHDVQELRALARETELAIEDNDLIRHSQADMNFHMLLLSLAGNATLVDTVRDIRKRSRLRGLQSEARREQLRQSAHEHLQIVDLVVDGDVEGVQALTTKHINDVRALWSHD